MYITSFSVTQKGDAVGHVASLVVTWTFGDQACNVVAVAVAPAGAPPSAAAVSNSQIKNNSPTSATVAGPAGTVLQVSVFPRLIDARNTLLDQMPDRDGQQQPFETFGLSRTIVTRDTTGVVDAPVDHQRAGVSRDTAR